LRVQEVKNLSLDGYRARLNIRPLGGEGVPFFFILSCSIAKKNISEWYFVSITEEERFCSSDTDHISRENPQRVHLSLYLHHFFTREKRAEEPHLLAGFFSHIGFPRSYLVFIYGWCECVLLFSIFLRFIYFFNKLNILEI
jgi:hypothetical protein